MGGKYDLRHFAYEHLPPHLRRYSQPVAALARQMVESLPAGAERNAGLRKLLEAKDCFVRAAVEARGAGIEANFDPSAYEGVAVPKPGSHYEIDPITGNPLPAGSPYSMAHKAKDHLFITSGRIVDYAPGYSMEAEKHRVNCNRLKQFTDEQCNCDQGKAVKDDDNSV